MAGQRTATRLATHPFKAPTQQALARCQQEGVAKWNEMGDASQDDKVKAILNMAANLYVIPDAGLQEANGWLVLPDAIAMGDPHHLETLLVTRSKMCSGPVPITACVTFAEELRNAAFKARVHWNENIAVSFASRQCEAPWDDHALLAVKCQRQFVDVVKDMIHNVEVTRRVGRKIVQEGFKTFGRDDEEVTLMAFEFRVNLPMMGYLDEEIDEKKDALDFLTQTLTILGLERTVAWEFISYVPRKTSRCQFRFVVKAYEPLQMRVAQDFRSKLPSDRNKLDKAWSWRVSNVTLYVFPVHLNAINTYGGDLVVPDEARVIGVKDDKGNVVHDGPRVKSYVQQVPAEKKAVTELKVALEMERIAPKVRS